MKKVRSPVKHRQCTLHFQSHCPCSCRSANWNGQTKLLRNMELNCFILTTPLLSTEHWLWQLVMSHVLTFATPSDNSSWAWKNRKIKCFSSPQMVSVLACCSSLEWEKRDHFSFYFRQLQPEWAKFFWELINKWPERHYSYVRSAVKNVFWKQCPVLKGRCLAGKNIKYSEVTQAHCKQYLHYIIMYYSLYKAYATIYRMHNACIALCSMPLYDVIYLYRSINSETNDDIVHLHCTLQKSTQTHTMQRVQ